jgi:predicted DCC family thiol-disulfide oxidoreductase YuxK
VSIGGIERVTVLYDEACGFCRWSAAKLRTWDRRGLLGFEPLGSDAAGAILHDLDPETRLDSWHLATSDGRVYSRGAAVPELLRRLPGGRVPAAAARLMPGTTDRTYRILAANRGRLGQLIGVRACAADPSRSRR